MVVVSVLIQELEGDGIVSRPLQSVVILPLHPVRIHCHIAQLVWVDSDLKLVSTRVGVHWRTRPGTGTLLVGHGELSNSKSSLVFFLDIFFQLFIDLCYLCFYLSNFFTFLLKLCFRLFGSRFTLLSKLLDLPVFLLSEFLSLSFPSPSSSPAVPCSSSARVSAGCLPSASPSLPSQASRCSRHN